MCGYARATGSFRYDLMKLSVAAKTNPTFAPAMLFYTELLCKWSDYVDFFDVSQSEDVGTVLLFGLVPTLKMKSCQENICYDSDSFDCYRFKTFKTILYNSSLDRKYICSYSDNQNRNRSL
ncbi:hypothetical protein F2P81_022609 [Scophthalmus maximus]|uniref:Uncharacterized protein n=1 Tax=Scophthalmus maximus TaxID=52904 RepID=A0A6A4S0R5_SCOMX|nr:hypothetical protein F2P81_022609 [Scophthalmus maximus]